MLTSELAAQDYIELQWGDQGPGDPGERFPGPEELSGRCRCSFFRELSPNSLECSGSGT